MNRITHKQAIKWINRRLDGLLTKKQVLLLGEHLDSCDACRAYAAVIESLPAQLQNEFHAHWDEKPGPSQRVMQHVTTKARNIPMTNRISAAAKLFAGAVALIMLGLAINFVVSQLKSTTITAIGTEPVNTLPRAEDRLLAFTSEQNGNLDIYTMHADGSGVTNLTNNPAWDGNPFWSPDGKHIAFQSDRNGSMQIYRMDADGSHVTQITDGKMDEQLESSNPWSPDGTRFLFTEREPIDPTQRDAKWMFYAVDMDGQNKAPITPAPNMYGFPLWSPDGKQIAFLAIETQGVRNLHRIYVVDANGGNLTDVTKLLPANENLIPGDYAWSPGGQSITFIAQKHIDEGKDQWIVYEASLDGDKLTQLTTSSTPMGDWWDETAFITGFGGDSPFTWLRSDGTYSTLKPFEKCERHDNSSSSYIYRRSPNGNLLIGVSCPNSDLWFYWANPDGTIVKQLLDSPITDKDFSIMNIVWSTDDKYVAFNVASSDKTRMGMYMLNIEAALKDPSIRPLQISVGGNSDTYDWYPAWQPKP